MEGALLNINQKVPDPLRFCHLSRTWGGAAMTHSQGFICRALGPALQYSLWVPNLTRTLQ